MRLAWSNTASQDEAIALWAGPLMWSHWLHDITVPPFQAYLPGAPVIYPPLGALADHVAGLAGARLLSLAMMLGVTVLLWSTAARLFGRRAAVFAAALFAILAPALQLGALATGVALSLLLLAVSTWSVVRAGSREDATGWMILSGSPWCWPTPRPTRRSCSIR
jgi:4-amino-4-deoxy-L-arabinose transferase-like glycosyltransferase